MVAKNTVDNALANALTLACMDAFMRRIGNPQSEEIVRQITSNFLNNGVTPTLAQLSEACAALNISLFDFMVEVTRAAKRD